MVTSDEELLQQVLTANQNAFRELVERYKAYVFAIILNLLPASSDAEDIAQEVFMQVYRSLPEQLKISIYSENSDIQIHAKNILNDWYINGIQSVVLDLPAASNLQLAAKVNSQSELQGNAGWIIKDRPPTNDSNSEYEEPTGVEGSLNLGAGQHKMIINSNGPVSVDLLP